MHDAIAKAGDRQVLPLSMNPKVPAQDINSAAHLTCTLAFQAQFELIEYQTNHLL